jgi:hypothetical protein
MSLEDVEQINRHLEVLHEELLDLGRAVDRSEVLRREAALDAVEAAFGETLEALVDLEAAGATIEPAGLIERLITAFHELGLGRCGAVGAVRELWPEEAREDYTLDEELPPAAMMVRVEITAQGWCRGSKIVTPPRGRVLEVIEDEA